MNNLPHPVPHQVSARWIGGNVLKDCKEVLAAHIFLLHGTLNVTGRRKRNVS